jgi:hypothetical protein
VEDIEVSRGEDKLAQDTIGKAQVRSTRGEGERDVLSLPRPLFSAIVVVVKKRKVGLYSGPRTQRVTRKINLAVFDDV